MLYRHLPLQRDMLSSNFIALLSFLLEQQSPQNLSVDLLMSIERLIKCCSTASTSPRNISVMCIHLLS